jgi:hypothetical protein
MALVRARGPQRRLKSLKAHRQSGHRSLRSLGAQRSRCSGGGDDGVSSERMRGLGPRTDENARRETPPERVIHRASLRTPTEHRARRRWAPRIDQESSGSFQGKAGHAGGARLRRVLEPHERARLEQDRGDPSGASRPGRRNDEGGPRPAMAGRAARQAPRVMATSPGWMRCKGSMGTVVLKGPDAAGTSREARLEAQASGRHPRMVERTQGIPIVAEAASPSNDEQAPAVQDQSLRKGRKSMGGMGCAGNREPGSSMGTRHGSGSRGPKAGGGAAKPIAATIEGCTPKARDAGFVSAGARAHDVTGRRSLHDNLPRRVLQARTGYARGIAAEALGAPRAHWRIERRPRLRLAIARRRPPEVRADREPPKRPEGPGWN